MFNTLVARMFNAFIGSQNIRYFTLPDAAVPVTLQGAGAWAYPANCTTIVTQANVVAALAVYGFPAGNDVWLMEIAFDNPTAITNYDVEYGIGLTGAPFVTRLGHVPVLGAVATLTYPVRIAAATLAASGIAGRIRSQAGTPDSINVKLRAMSGL